MAVVLQTKVETRDGEDYLRIRKVNLDINVKKYIVSEKFYSAVS